MNIEPATPTVKNPPEQFAGDVWVDFLAVPHEADQRMRVAIVRFAPGGRTFVVVCFVNHPNAARAQAPLDALVEWVYAVANGNAAR